jgi:threonine/homoserine/homoserine lactone efflux protein
VLVALVSFTFASVLIVLLPGPDSLVVVRGLVRGGRRGGASTAAGVLAGLAVWVAATTLGLSALLRASETGY